MEPSKLEDHLRRCHPDKRIVKTVALFPCRNKRKINSTALKDQALKRSKICRKRSRQGSEHQDRKRRAPEHRQGVKRSIPSSVSSRNYKFQKHNTSSPGVESIAGPSRLPDRRTATTTGGSRMEVSGRDNQTRQIRTTTRGRNKQAEKPVRSNQATTRRPCPYYLRSRIQENDGIPGGVEQHRNQRHTSQHITKKPQYGSVGWRSSA
ncbi:hypothetical protein TNCV_1318121 [Trichonephila clavipes]|nr:hypothetical protein TNCV_1318121 [Trichonephila clavipes]